MLWMLGCRVWFGHFVGVSGSFRMLQVSEFTMQTAKLSNSIDVPGPLEVFGHRSPECPL